MAFFWEVWDLDWKWMLATVLGRGAPSCLPIFYSAVALSLSTAMRSVDLLTLLNGPLQLVPGSGRSLENPGIACGY